MTETTDPKSRNPLAQFKRFQRPFWVINGVEFLERGAYYGMLSVLSVFMSNDLGLSPETTGFLLAIQFPLLYFIPVIAGALAEKFGFKTMLLITFASLIGGYAAIASAQGIGGIVLGTVLYGFGAGIFKPMPAATVAQTTSEQDRNFGFGIYYWMINAGAFVIPVGLAAVFGGNFRAYFWVAAVVSIVNLAASAFVWKNIVPAKPSVKVSTALKGLSELGKYPAFIVLLTIYAGFWFMYTMTTSYLQIYAVEFNIIGPGLVALLVPLNALAILVAGPILSKVTERMASIPLMVLGITIYISGFVLLGFIPTAIMLFASIIIYSVGEFLTHPGFLSYVTKISPKERVAVFLGYGFLPIGVGQFFGSIAGGYIYAFFARDLNKPQLFWASISAIGLVTLAALIVYNLVLERRKAAASEPTPVATTQNRGRGGWTMAAAALLAIPLLMAGGVFAPALESIGGAGGGDLVGVANAEESELTHAIFESIAEGSVVSQTTGFAASTTNGRAVLTWTDEAPATPGGINEGDRFVVRVVGPDGTVIATSDEVTNTPGSAGQIELMFAPVAGDLTFQVELLEAGDHQAAGGLPFSIAPTQTDDGNAAELTVFGIVTA